MKTIAAIVLLSCCAFGQDKAAVSAAEAACGPQDAGFEVTPDDSHHPTFTPENSKALIYVVQRTTGVMKFGADGKWLGASKPGTYFFASLEPGEHHLCVAGRLPLWKGLSLHALNAKAGETYYFFVHVVAGGGYDELTLSQVDPDEGKELVARAKFGDSHPK
jgi:diadenosine tetraphosphatase ApaH/serine/threonine PP2A family protein phosphatase